MADFTKGEEYRKRNTTRTQTFAKNQFTPARLLPEKKCPEPGSRKLGMIFIHRRYTERSSVRKTLMLAGKSYKAHLPLSTFRFQQVEPAFVDWSEQQCF
jgi:hypothetical protein